MWSYTSTSRQVILTVVPASKFGLSGSANPVFPNASHLVISLHVRAGSGGERTHWRATHMVRQTVVTCNPMPFDYTRPHPLTLNLTLMCFVSIRVLSLGPNRDYFPFASQETLGHKTLFLIVM